MPARKNYIFFIGLNLVFYLKSFLGQKNTFFLADRQEGYKTNGNRCSTIILFPGNNIGKSVNQSNCFSLLEFEH